MRAKKIRDTMKEECKWMIAFYLIVFLVGTIFSTSYALAATYGTYSRGSAVSTRYQPAPSFQTLYGSNVNTYWPILGDKETCEAREDFMLQMAPFGCQPAVVRSDLLAEQDVPVFCQINAIDINPLIKVEQIKNIQFRGQYPAEISGVGFHPARAALRSYNTLLGSPLSNNLGYVVVVLKRQPEEAKLPDSVNVSLQAYIEYEAENAYGIGKSEFVLEPVSFEDWESEKLKQSFWNGRYFVRLESVDDNYAEVSIYEGDRRAITTRVQKGQTSNDFYLPGMYCRAGLKIAYDSYVAAQKKARIEISSGGSFDSFDVYEGSNFYDGRCTVRRIDINSDGETGRVIGSCRGKQFVLELRTKSNESATNFIFVDGKKYSVDKIGNKYWIDLGNYSSPAIRGMYFYEDGKLFREEGNLQILDGNGSFGVSVNQDQKVFYQTLYSLVKSFVESNEVTGARPQSSSHFADAIGSYERVVDDYPGESDGLYGKEALQKAIDLAREFGDDTTRARLINRYIGLYPDDAQTESYKFELEGIRQFDSSLAGEAIEFDNNVRVLRLVSLESPAKKSYADLTVQGKGMRLALESTKDLMDGDRKVGTIKLDRVDVDKAEVGAYCLDRSYDGRNVSSTRKQSFILRVTDNPKKICGVEVRLDSTDVERAAKIRLIPKAEGSRTETNLTVFVGIEKRAIELTPDKVSQKIENLNKTIQKWQKIADTLGKVVTGLKGACFATATLLTFKNFMTGLSGEAIARQEVMNGDNGWTQRCKELVPNSYPSMDACYIAKASEIDADVAKTTAAINKVNARIQQIQSGHTKSIDVFGKSVDTEAVRKDLASDIKSQYGTQTINLGDKTWKRADGTETNVVTVNELLTEENVNNGLISTEAMRSLMLNAELQKQGGLNVGMLNNTGDKLADVATRVNENMVVNWEFEKNKAMQGNGYPAAFEAASQNSQTRYAAVRPLTQQLRMETGFTDPKITHIAVVRVSPGMSRQGGGVASYVAGMYNLGLEGDPQTGTYSIREVTKQGNTTKVDPAGFATTYNLGNIKALDSASYQNEIQSSDRYVRYYETEPYKGMPAIVPFDTKAGWYAATQQTLPAFGGIGAFDASGRVTSFWICNVGKNGRIQFDSGFGDDLCQQININTGQPLNMFPGLDSSKASTLIQRGQNAIMEAARQYGNKFVTIGGERFEIGKPATGAPSTQCQDFMSPKDCHLMFNVCDPVVCPSSRCNFGGTYNVANVAQTGIVGSIFLCLPNIREGILIPVCLTGIHAGIEGWISIMKNYRDCLQENLETGQMVGICDQIYSIYLCEFFWNQVAPFVNVLIPKLIEMAYGQGVRGGAEYLSVMSAWQNMENSINYFTQSYAVNSFEAFRARGVEEVGTEFCKAFISVKSPTAFDTLLEPDSPPQFHAWFDEKTFTTATVPATSQYKVFYHIFAGNDRGVHYNVYLRDPPTSGYYAASPTISVASGFIPKGEYASQTRDFTAPEGYKELCVRINNDEECGFKQVSSSFAVNYLRDSYIKNEASRVTITSQKECVSGSNNPATLLTPNVQQGVEEFVSPELYNRGIVRICSSENPGSKTDPSRFVDVGYCDTPQIRCWIDQRSIEQAITQGNVGTLNETLEVLDARAKALLDAQNITYGDAEAENKLMLLKSKVKGLGSIEEAFVVINESNELFDKLFWNRHKAEALIVRGDAQAYIARHYRGIEDALRPDIVVPEDEPPQDDEGELSGGGTVGGARASGFIGSSVNMFNDYDFKNCPELVKRAVEKGAPAVNLAPTFFARINKTNGVEEYLFGDAENGVRHVPFTQERIDKFSEAMYACMKEAYDNGLAISTHPQLDIEPGSSGESWRNGYVFNPTQRVDGYSYRDIMLEPLAKAAVRLEKNVQMDFSMQGEMGGTLFDYPAEWNGLVEEYKTRFNEHPNIRVGINFNFNTISGNKNDWTDTNWFDQVQPTGPSHDREKFQTLINSVEFIGFSAYEKTDKPTTHADLYAHIVDWEDKFRRNGIMMPSVPWKFSEYGLGGGANVGSCSLTQESPNRCPWEGPLQLKEKACPTLWTGENKELRYSYYKALVDFMGYSDHRIDSAYLWNLDTWDVQGIYKGLLESSEPCRDEQIEAMLKNYNSKFTKLYGPQGSSGGGDSAEVCQIKDVAVQGQNVVVGGADSGLKVSGDQIVSTEAGAERPIIAITGGIYGWIPGIDLSKLDASKRKVAEAIVGSTPQKLEDGEVVVEDCGTRRQDVPYELGDKVSFSNMIVEFVYVDGEKSQVYLSGGYVYVYSDSGEQKIGTYLPDDSTIQIDSLDNVKTDPGYFSIFDFRNFFVFERDYNILTTLKNGKYSYCDLGGEDCGSSEAKEGVLSNICNDVCAGFFGCNRDECDAAGDCYFVGRALAKNECHSCEGMSCIAYPNEETCTDDMCGILCEWDDADDLCFGFGSNIIERSGKTPCFDLERRLKVDFGESIGSYGLSSGNRLEWYLNGVGWIDVKSDSRANWNSKTPQLKEWAIQLERELVNLKNSGGELMTCRDSELSLDNVVLVFNEASAELTFYYKQPSGALEDFNLRVKPDNEFIENRQGVGLAILNKKVGGIVAGSPTPLIGVGNFACIHVSSEKFEDSFYGIFKVGDLDKSKIVRTKQTGNDQFDLMPDDGSCEIVEEPFTLEDMFELVEVSGVVRFYFHSNRESSLKDTGLYINLNEGGGVVIKNQAGPAVGSLSDSISAMRHAGKTPVIRITNHVDVLIDGSPAFKTSCLDQQRVIEQDGKLKIDFVNGAATGCPEL